MKNVEQVAAKIADIFDGVVSGGNFIVDTYHDISENTREIEKELNLAVKLGKISDWELVGFNCWALF